MWAIEQVVALAGSSARFGAGEAVAVPSRWSRTGASGRALWGRYHGVWLRALRGRRRPRRRRRAVHVPEQDRTRASTSSPSSCCGCAATVPTVTEPPTVARWLDGRQRRLAEQRAQAAGAPADAPAPIARDATIVRLGDDEPPAEPSERARDERIEKLVGGLIELDRWLEDRLRGGLADPSIARFATWDEVARRLTDARAGALANRVRRLAGRVGAEPDWHDHVLAEIGILHLLAQAGQRVPRLPSDLADGVAVACGWQVRKADVEAVAPETDRWLVAGRSDTREDLVEVRRVWLRGVRVRALGDGAVVRRLPPGPRRLAVGRHHRPCRPAPLSGLGAAGAGGRGHRRRGDASGGAHRRRRSGHDDLRGMSAGRRRARRGAVARACAGHRHRGDHPCRRPLGAHRRHRLAGDRPGVGAAETAVATLLAASSGQPATLAVEWTPRGVVPLTVFLDDRALDVGPRADPSFVSAA